MKKVKEYLDKNLFPQGDSSFNLKENGHCGVQGYWIYPINWKPKSLNEWLKLKEEEKNPDHMSIIINNETIIVGNMSVDGVWIKYHYLQTYDHIPRGEPDENGYYRRSTEDEIIKYLDEYYQKIKSNYDR